MSEAQHCYAVIVERQVEKALRRLPRDILTRVDRLLMSLADEPHFAFASMAYPRCMIRIDCEEDLS